MKRGERAEERPEGEAEHGRRDGQPQRIAERVQERGGDRLIGDDGDAEVAAQHAAEPVHVLYVHRPVEAQLGPDLEGHLFDTSGGISMSAASPGAILISAKTTIDTPSKMGTA